MSTMSIRVDLDGGGRLGPGKVALLEGIAEHGSISAAGRAMAMSYKRAWQLVADINASFKKPLVQSQPGGRQGGGATVTPLGLELIAHYRAIETEARAAVAERLAALESAAATRR